MESVKALPPPLRTIEVPEFLNVSRLAKAGECLLCAVVPWNSLPPRVSGPAAELGKLVHTLAELVVTNNLGRSGVPSTISQAFEHLLENKIRQLSSRDETLPFADLRTAFSKQEWERRRYEALELAHGLVNNNWRLPNNAVTESKGERPSLSRMLERNVSRVAEVPFESRNLRIRGRLDLLEIVGPNKVTVCDFKSGSVTSSEGLLKEDILLQLQLYGLAVLDIAPEKLVSLRVLSRDGEFSVSFGDAERSEAAEWLADKIERLPAGDHLDAKGLAQVGPQCKACEIRPVCPAYRNAAGALWARTDTPFELPLDIAGIMIEAKTQDEKYLSLKMTDLGGRIVKVHRLRPRDAFATTPSHPVWFFDLASIERTWKTSWRHPRNFHEMSSSGFERTAWTLRVFLADDQDA